MWEILQQRILPLDDGSRKFQSRGGNPVRKDASCGRLLERVVKEIDERAEFCGVRVGISTLQSSMLGQKTIMRTFATKEKDRRVCCGARSRASAAFSVRTTHCAAAAAHTPAKSARCLFRLARE